MSRLAIRTICDALLTAIGASYLLFAYVSGNYSFPYIPVCPFYLLTSWQCPLCGMTRSLEELLHGNIGSAVAYHPLAIGFLVFWICFTAYFGLSALKDVRGFLAADS